MAVTPKPEPTGFPPLTWEAEDVATRPMALHELPRQAGIDRNLAIVEQHHERIAKVIGIFWGTHDCVEYIHKLVTKGDGQDGRRIGFKPEVVSALMHLISLHRVEPSLGK